MKKNFAFHTSCKANVRKAKSDFLLCSFTDSAPLSRENQTKPTQLRCCGGNVAPMGENTQDNTKSLSLRTPSHPHPLPPEHTFQGTSSDLAHRLCGEAPGPGVRPRIWIAREVSSILYKNIEWWSPLSTHVLFFSTFQDRASLFLLFCLICIGSGARRPEV